MYHTLDASSSRWYQNDRYNGVDGPTPVSNAPNQKRHAINPAALFVAAWLNSEMREYA